MRIAIATVQVPFISGGAESLARGLSAGFRLAGHEVETVTMPFRFAPESEVSRTMGAWEAEDFTDINGCNPDLVVCLKFPAYYLSHPRKVIWLLHQHRSVYDLWDEHLAHSAEAKVLRDQIVAKDTAALSSAERVYTIAKNVSRRLQKYNGIQSMALYHPPPLAGNLYSVKPESYIFMPSRLETLKRQELLIRAMKLVKSPMVALIAGEGGQRSRYERLIEELGVGSRVRLLGNLTERELLGYYACSLAVFFGPQDEDYGYVTLEAMLAGKPVITCSDSGGPLEFVVHNQTGYVISPRPDELASAIDRLYENRALAIELGRSGLVHYYSMNISWERTVCELLQS